MTQPIPFYSEYPVGRLNGNGVYTCQKCHALVMSADRHEHRRWHGTVDSRLLNDEPRGNP